MSYEEIFLYGWSLNFLMLLANLFLAIKTMGSKTREELLYENGELSKLKEEFDTFYPYRKFETLASYLIPFTAFFRMSYRFLEMYLFFSKNKETTLFDFMIYKYSSDINRAKNR